MQEVPFEISDIKRICGQTYYERGARYAQHGNVTNLDVEHSDEDTLYLEANVRGSERYPYSVNVVVKTLRQQVNIIGQCTCPIAFNCKHVVAACVAYRRSYQRYQNKTTSVDSTDLWLQRLKESQIQASPLRDNDTKVSESFSLLYFLSMQTGRPVVQVMRVRNLKKGGYGAGAPMKIHRITEEYSRDPIVDEKDEEIVILLKTGQLNYYDARFELKGDLGEIALEKILQTGRCHWNNQNSDPLYPSSTRPLSFEWQDAKNGRQLKPLVSPEANLLFIIEQAFFLDTEKNECGLLQTPLNNKQLAPLLDAPVIPKQKLKDVSRHLLLEIPDIDLPAPVDIGIHDEIIESENPIPLLTLYQRAVTVRSGITKLIHFVRLEFIYGSVKITPNNFESIKIQIDGDTRYRIMRAIDTEMAAFRQLLECGLEVPQRIGIQEAKTAEFLMAGSTLENSVRSWHEFIDIKIPALQEQGWQVVTEDSFALRIETIENWSGTVHKDSEQDWFSLELGVELNGEQINLLPALVDLLSQSNDPAKLRESLLQDDTVLIPLDDTHWLKLPSERLLSIFDTLVELYDKDPLNAEGRLRFSQFQGIQIGELLNDPHLSWSGAEQFQEIAAKLKELETIEHIDPPATLTTELRAYQLQGLTWLYCLRELGFNGILADDMGLGKTVQTLAHLLLEKTQGRADRPTLIVAPTSLMGNWRREAERFCPDLSVLLLHGQDRKEHLKHLNDYDLILTTYALVRRDLETLQGYQFHYVVLDEAQAIKNPKAQTTQSVCALKTRHRLCLTGTPMENHLGEMWSMYHFLMPGYLGPMDRFTRQFRTPIEKNGHAPRQLQLQKRIKPFLLRRTKQDVVQELPEKTEIIRTVMLESKQRDLYESIRMAMDKKVREEISRKGFARSHIMILDALLKLRQVCCDPRLVSLERAKKVTQSAKLDLLMTMLPEMIAEGRKILIFSQFTTMLSIIEKAITAQNITYSKLTGQTRKREEAISFFQEGPAEVFLISLKAGGVGLNLTAADTVIHYDPWWNPAVENQATDRAHRIGQDKAVFVYKLITENTVEDKIIALQQKKQQLADAIYGNKELQTGSLLSVDVLEDLLKPMEAIN